MAKLIPTIRFTAKRLNKELLNVLDPLPQSLLDMMHGSDLSVGLPQFWEHPRNRAHLSTFKDDINPLARALSMYAYIYPSGSNSSIIENIIQFAKKDPSAIVKAEANRLIEAYNTTEFTLKNFKPLFTLSSISMSSAFQEVEDDSQLRITESEAMQDEVIRGVDVTAVARAVPMRAVVMTHTHNFEQLSENTKDAEAIHGEGLNQKVAELLTEQEQFPLILDKSLCLASELHSLVSAKIHELTRQLDALKIAEDLISTIYTHNDDSEFGELFSKENVNNLQEDQSPIYEKAIHTCSSLVKAKVDKEITLKCATLIGVLATEATV